MSALPQRRPDNSAPDPIRVFKEKYAEALVAARVSAEHTATEGWQKLYAGHRLIQRDQRRELAKSLKALAVSLEDRGLTDDEQKTLAAVKKSSEEINDADASFDIQTISPVREPVLVCDRLRHEAMNEARRIESDAPLTNMGLEELMRVEVSGAAKPTWDADAGRVAIEGNE